ncbi:MAG: AAA family ATPase [Thiohalocapsa sp.]|jgi:general secretion pathway protein A|uniref:ExeA family protein n=1 Tax=Thiohalocapsa sp. TaxID=2497641 RepID=UPI0025F4EE5A|nr:AAA family ATPase [Thiohalocapsa sp.]MCG6942385.1 AAA family ATPase [Thiohalocapsa sp.]
MSADPAANPQPVPAEDASIEPGRIGARNPPRPAFENTRDTRFYFPSAAHREALSRLLFLAHDRNMGIGLLTGEIGAGKTLLRTLLYARLSAAEHVRVNLENSLLDFDGLLLEILSQMRGARVHSVDLPDRYSRLAAFKRTLSEQVAAQDKHLIVLVDEAQQLSLETLEALKALTNIASERQNFLTLILIGQPELRQRLARLPQVEQRVSLRFHLGALAEAETGDYMRHRLAAAGFVGEPPVDAAAVALLHRVSRGIPREINRLCKLALEHLLTQGRGRLDAAAVGVIVDDLRRHGALPEILDDPLHGTAHGGMRGGLDDLA